MKNKRHVSIWYAVYKVPTHQTYHSNLLTARLQALDNPYISLLHYILVIQRKYEHVQIIFSKEEGLSKF